MPSKILLYELRWDARTCGSGDHPEFDSDHFMVVIKQGQPVKCLIHLSMGGPTGIRQWRMQCFDAATKRWEEAGIFSWHDDEGRSVQIWKMIGIDTGERVQR